MILVIDNYDSFAHNLARYMDLAGWTHEIVRNDKITVAGIEALKPQAIIMSPGPKGPKDAGICVDLVKKLGANIPMLGVCLGHQCIAEAYDARVERAARVYHGKASVILHDGDELFAGLPKAFKGGRYHSLIVPRENERLKVTARTNDGEIMAMRHVTHPVFGVQFHPESVLTEHGMDIIRNFTTIALQWNARNLIAA